MKPKAFTLIELLIVVAIIAILAAIAVPNFLEAQVRAKVSRCNADQRAIATAMAAYEMDNNNQPVPMWIGDDPLMGQRRLQRLTTPVAYISSIPNDPFAAENQAPYDWLFHRNGYMYHHIWGPYAWGVGEPGPYQRGRDQGLRWALASRGPTLAFDVYMEYDPTNGTRSRGDVIYMGY